jgi:peroxiredoxin
MKSKILLLIVICLSIFGLLMGETDEEKSTLIKIGDVAPDISFTTLDGVEYTTESLKGKVVLINFFATWCGPCNAEIPHLNTEVFEKIKDDDFFMVGIGREHVADTLTKFVEKKDILYPIAPDPKREIYSKFAERYIPRNFVIGKDGKVLFQCVGFDQKDFDQMIGIIKEE